MLWLNINSSSLELLRLDQEHMTIMTILCLLMGEPKSLTLQVEEAIPRFLENELPFLKRERTMRIQLLILYAWVGFQKDFKAMALLNRPLGMLEGSTAVNWRSTRGWLASKPTHRTPVCPDYWPLHEWVRWFHRSCQWSASWSTPWDWLLVPSALQFVFSWSSHAVSSRRHFYISKCKCKEQMAAQWVLVPKRRHKWDVWPGVLVLGAGWHPENGPSASHTKSASGVLRGADTPPCSCSAVAVLDCSPSLSRHHRHLLAWDGWCAEVRKTDKFVLSFLLTPTTVSYTRTPIKRWSTECPRTPASLYFFILWSYSSPSTCHFKNKTTERNDLKKLTTPSCF